MSVLSPIELQEESRSILSSPSLLLFDLRVLTEGGLQQLGLDFELILRFSCLTEEFCFINFCICIEDTVSFELEILFL